MTPRPDYPTAASPQAGLEDAKPTGQHTPGPWRVTHQTLTDASFDVVAAGEVVAVCGYTQDSQLANCRQRPPDRGGAGTVDGVTGHRSPR